MGTDILAEFERLADQLVEDQRHQERAGEQIDFVKPAMAEIQAYAPQINQNSPKQHHPRMSIRPLFL
jgi:hypothetical protein